MCNKKTYKRLKKLHSYITDKDCNYTREFDGVCYPYKVFTTKLGDRAVISEVINKAVVIGYHDYDNSLLFLITCQPNGKIHIVDSKIDEIAIFSAIYELECLIWEQKHEEREKLLEDLFSYLNPVTGTSYGYFDWQEAIWKRK